MPMDTQAGILSSIHNSKSCLSSREGPWETELCIGRLLMCTGPTNDLKVKLRETRSPYWDSAQRLL